MRAHHCRPGGYCRPEAPGRSVAAADSALDLADQAGLADRERTDQHPAREGRGRSHPRLRPEREGSALGSTGRTAGHDGAGPRRAYRREGGGGGRHRQAAGDGHHLPAPAAQRLDWFAGHAGPTVRNPQGGAGGHRQWHRLARDGQAGGRPDARPAAAAPDQGRGLRGRRLGVFGLGAGSAGIPGAGREPAGRGFHRPSPAGSAGRAGQDRAQGHRRGPVPARREPDPPGQGAGRRGGGLRQRRGRGPEHGQRAAAHPHCGSGAVTGREHRPTPRPERPLPQPQGAAGRDAPGCQGLPAIGRLPAHPGRRQPAGCFRRPPRGLSRGAEDAGRSETRHQRCGGPAQRHLPPGPGPLHRREVRPAHHPGHPEGAGKAGPRPPPRVPYSRLQGRRGQAGRPAPRHDAGRRGDERGQLRRLRRHRRPPGRPRAHLGAVGPLREGSA